MSVESNCQDLRPRQRAHAQISAIRSDHLDRRCVLAGSMWLNRVMCRTGLMLVTKHKDRVGCDYGSTCKDTRRVGSALRQSHHRYHLLRTPHVRHGSCTTHIHRAPVFGRACARQVGHIRYDAMEHVMARKRWEGSIGLRRAEVRGNGTPNHARACGMVL